MYNQKDLYFPVDYGDLPSLPQMYIFQIFLLLLLPCPLGWGREGRSP
jgi:hypothetical protein